MASILNTPPLSHLIKRLRIPCATGEATLILLSGDHWGPWLNAAIHQAQASILLSVYMVSHHWRAHHKGDLNLLAALEQAAQRGVQCRAILGNPNAQHTPENYNRDAGQRLAAAGWRIRAFTGPRVLHEKTLIIDRQIALIGSHNLSRSSAASNFDTSIAIESPEIITVMFKQFWDRWRTAQPPTP